MIVFESDQFFSFLQIRNDNYGLSDILNQFVKMFTKPKIFTILWFEKLKNYNHNLNEKLLNIIFQQVAATLHHLI